MTERRELVIERWSPARDSPAVAVLGRLLAAYHLQTEAEKGVAVTGVVELPERYRSEVLDPHAAFARDTVLLAFDGADAVGCVVVTATAEQQAEIKRLWVDQASRGRGTAKTLVGAALTHAAQNGATTVRLSVWDWRATAIALYERLGFTVTETWDARNGLVCMQRSVTAPA
jgi:ribosomal protein S18 acetylase RimI-like enzyme